MDPILKKYKELAFFPHGDEEHGYQVYIYVTVLRKDRDIIGQEDKERLVEFKELKLAGKVADKRLFGRIIFNDWFLKEYPDLKDYEVYHEFGKTIIKPKLQSEESLASSKKSAKSTAPAKKAPKNQLMFGTYAIQAVLRKFIELGNSKAAQLHLDNLYSCVMCLCTTGCLDRATYTEFIKSFYNPAFTLKRLTPKVINEKLENTFSFLDGLPFKKAIEGFFEDSISQITPYSSDQKENSKLIVYVDGAYIENADGQCVNALEAQEITGDFKIALAIRCYSDFEYDYDFDDDDDEDDEDDDYYNYEANQTPLFVTYDSKHPEQCSLNDLWKILEKKSYPKENLCLVCDSAMLPEQFYRDLFEMGIGVVLKTKQDSPEYKFCADMAIESGLIDSAQNKKSSAKSSKLYKNFTKNCSDENLWCTEYYEPKVLNSLVTFDPVCEREKLESLMSELRSFQEVLATNGQFKYDQLVLLKKCTNYSIKEHKKKRKAFKLSVNQERIDELCMYYGIDVLITNQTAYSAMEILGLFNQEKNPFVFAESFTQKLKALSERHGKDYIKEVKKYGQVLYTVDTFASFEARAAMAFMAAWVDHDLVNSMNSKIFYKSHGYKHNFGALQMFYKLANTRLANVIGDNMVSLEDESHISTKCFNLVHRQNPKGSYPTSWQYQ